MLDRIVDAVERPPPICLAVVEEVVGQLLERHALAGRVDATTLAARMVSRPSTRVARAKAASKLV
jgi:hypothetical protein